MMNLDEMIRQAIVERNLDPNHLSECREIVSIAKNRLGLNIGLIEAETIWGWHSDMMAAGWLCISNSQEVIDAILAYVDTKAK